jgi:predicted transport protein
MKLFSTNGDNLNHINEVPFGLEKDIQSITEANMEKVFGLEFVKSEHTLNNFRIDSLCFDPKTKSFVIVEYKNTKNFSVIDQGYSYLSLMLNNKAEFVLLYNELMDKTLRKDDVDWSQSKVIFVSPTYTVYQKESINFKDLPIELWEIKQFENKTVIYLPIKATKQTESINTISSSDSTISKVSKEVKTYTEEEHLSGKPNKIVELYESIKNEVLNTSDVTVKPNKQYIAFVGSKRNVADFVIKKSKITVYINLKYSEIEDYKNKVRDVTNIGSWGNGDCEFAYDSIDDVDYLLSLIKQSFKKNG